MMMMMMMMTTIAVSSKRQLSHLPWHSSSPVDNVRILALSEYIFCKEQLDQIAFADNLSIPEFLLEAAA